MRILLATNNAKKLIELQQLLGDSFELLTLKDVGIDNVPDETGTTFRENALIKAQAAQKHCDLPVISDDSGLCVEALNGEPGVYSAEYGKPLAVTDQDRNELLLRNMNLHNNRACYFVCCFCLLLPNQPPQYFEGYCHGELLRQPQGENGFGYDPIFYLPQFEKTMAELTPNEKNSVSHRGQAAQKLKEYLSC